jgi:hypothetical protein
MAVAPGAPGFLEVALERRRRLVVNDVADVRLVDAEAERARRDHDDALPLRMNRAWCSARSLSVILPW